MWLSSEEYGEYREYRLEERWVWNSYKTDYQTSREEGGSFFVKLGFSSSTEVLVVTFYLINHIWENCDKFFKYAIEKSEEYSEEWKKVQKSVFEELQSVFAVLSVNPKRGMTLFENLNFKSKKKWVVTIILFQNVFQMALLQTVVPTRETRA